MAVFSSAESRIAIANALPATNDQSGFEALTFTEIPNITDAGSVGPVQEVIELLTLDKQFTQKLKGTTNYGSQSVTIAADLTDASDTLLETARRNLTASSFRLTLGTGDIIYYTGLVTAKPFNVGGPNTIVETSFNIEINNEIVIVKV